MGDLVQYLQEFRKTTEVYLSVVINGVFFSDSNCAHLY